MDDKSLSFVWELPEWTADSDGRRSWLARRLDERWLGRAIALSLLILAAPAVLLAIVLVRVGSRGPAIYRQVRLGAHGRHFMMYKIRTMVADAEDQSGPVWARANDPRVTRWGRLLRSIGWDELPQLVNIVKGDMAFVGPRPERPEIASALADEIPGYYSRVAVRPGITGLAQINLSADAELDDVRRKLHLDMEYIHQANWFLDLRIVLATVPRLFAVRCAPLAKLLGVWRETPQPPTVLQLRVSKQAAHPFEAIEHPGESPIARLRIARLRNDHRRAA